MRSSSRSTRGYHRRSGGVTDRRSDAAVGGGGPSTSHSDATLTPGRTTAKPAGAVSGGVFASPAARGRPDPALVGRAGGAQAVRVADPRRPHRWCNPRTSPRLARSFAARYGWCPWRAWWRAGSGTSRNSRCGHTGRTAAGGTTIRRTQGTPRSRCRSAGRLGRSVHLACVQPILAQTSPTQIIPCRLLSPAARSSWRASLRPAAGDVAIGRTRAASGPIAGPVGQLMFERRLVRRLRFCGRRRATHVRGLPTMTVQKPCIAAASDSTCSAADGSGRPASGDWPDGSAAVFLTFDGLREAKVPRERHVSDSHYRAEFSGSGIENNRTIFQSSPARRSATTVGAEICCAWPSRV
jgi:hypothetical protein